MAELVRHTAACLGEGPARNWQRSGTSPASAELPLFRFRLRHLFLLVTAISVLLAAVVSLPGLTALALLVGVLVITFHVFSTALGSHLGRRADSRQAYRTEPRRTIPSVVRPAPTSAAASAKPWYGRSDARVGCYPRVIAFSALLGGCLGTLFLALAIGDRTSLAGLLVGGMSLAVISGWFAFLATTFFTIIRQGFRDAAAEQERGKTAVL